MSDEPDLRIKDDRWGRVVAAIMRTAVQRRERAENETAEHRYLSTGCLHGEHDYCQSMTGMQGEKRPGRCKFCDARCVCDCHREVSA